MTTPRIRTNRTSPNASQDLSQLTNDLVAQFAHRMGEAVELATSEHARDAIARIFSAVTTHRDFYFDKYTRRRQDRERSEIVASLTRQFLGAVEETLRARVRTALDRERARRRAIAASAPKATNLALGEAKPRRKPRRARPNLRLPPPLDPEQIKRDQEFARLRALLRPASAELPPAQPAPVPIASPVQAQRPASPGDVLRALEKEIQAAVPSLGTLGPERCGAQIAAWVGQVRGLRDSLPTDISATMRPAFRIFLEHLTDLHMQMEARLVDALEPNWKAPDWDIYVEANRAHAERRAPALSADQLKLHHHAMLRALVLPHRRNAPKHAMAVISAAAEALPPDDSLLKSAVRRHTTTSETPLPPAPAPAPAPVPVAETAPVVAAESPVKDVQEEPAEPVTSESEFDSTWTN